MLKSAKYLLILTLLASVAFSQQPKNDPILTELQKAVPDQVSKTADDDEVAIVYKRADFDQDHTFSYVVAAYGSPLQGAIQLFKLQGSQLQLVAESSPDLTVGLPRTELQVIDVDGDGVPEIVSNLFGAPGGEYTTSILRKQGSALVSMLGPDLDTRNAVLANLDNDGTLALVVPPDGRRLNGEAGDPTISRDASYKIYRPKNGIYQFSISQQSDPVFPGNTVIRAQKIVFKPFVVSLETLHRKHGNDDDERKILLLIGALQAETVSGTHSVGLDSISLDSLRLAGTLVPSRIFIRNESPDDEGRVGTSKSLDRQLLEADFSLEQIKQAIQRATFDHSPKAGETVLLPITAVLKDGSRLSAEARIRLSASQHDHDRDRQID